LKRRPSYLEVQSDAARALFARAPKGPIVMLNLIRLRAVADYAGNAVVASAEPISGRAAFDRYIDETLPLLRKSGGDLVFLGTGVGFLIGPPDERWDVVMLVRQQDLQTFLAFASNDAIQAALVHRTAAVEDSRLLPLVEEIRTRDNHRPVPPSETVGL
jgi:hypothetical protein